MREKVVELLEYTRQWLPDQMELEECPYGGNYGPSDYHCQRCALKPECSWLFNNNEFVALREKPLPALMLRLDLALWLVDARRPLGTHSCRCSCELCTWRRQTEKLLSANFARPSNRVRQW